MKNKTLVLCTIFTVLTGTAQADSGFYVRAMGGINANEGFRVTAIPAPPGSNIATVKNNHGFAYGAAFGYAFNNNVRAEAEATFRSNGVGPSVFAGGDFPFTSGRASSKAAMVNAYYDFKTDFPVTPYIGAGFGGADVSFTDYRPQLNLINVANGSGTAFAYQYMIGASYDITPKIALNLEYRYFATRPIQFLTALADINERTDYRNNTILGGVTYKF